MTTPAFKTTWNFGTQGDDFYAALISAHDGLSDANSQRLNARLILLLANHIGDAPVLIDALARARKDIDTSNR